MRYRLFRKRIVQAPRMSVRSDVPLRLQLVVGLVLFGIAVALGVVLGRFGTAPARAAVDQTIGRLMQENQILHEERPAPPAAAPVESQRIMENATIRELGDQVARLEAENARLKDDVAFFEAATAGRAVPGSVDTGGSIALRRFQVTKVGNRVRYRLLLTQDPKAQQDFVGTLQLVAMLQRGNQSSQLVLPETTAGAADRAIDDASGRAGFAVVFRSYKRIDGSFDLPQDAVVKSVEARILERGTVRVRLAAAPG